jgi:hypothetical protein
MAEAQRVHGTRAIALHQRFGWALHLIEDDNQDHRGVSVEEAERVIQDEPTRVFVDVPPDAAYAVSGHFEPQQDRGDKQP